MEKLSDTYKELGIKFTFPIEIEDANGNVTYYEDSNGWRRKCEFDGNGRQTYYEDSNKFWSKREYDTNGNQTYFEDNSGYKKGTKRGSCSGKVIEVDGKKYKLMEL